jgi:hypothetical protein
MFSPQGRVEIENQEITKKLDSLLSLISSISSNDKSDNLDVNSSNTVSVHNKSVGAASRIIATSFYLNSFVAIEI